MPNDFVVSVGYIVGAVVLYFGFSLFECLECMSLVA